MIHMEMYLDKNNLARLSIPMAGDAFAQSKPTQE